MFILDFIFGLIKHAVIAVGIIFSVLLLGKRSAAIRHAAFGPEPLVGGYGPVNQN